ncbi:MAG: hypothetical protein AAGF06_03550 [Pseudomonadota bacterium]
MSEQVLRLGKASTLAFWLLVVVSMTTDVFSVSTSRYLVWAGLGLLVMHAIEVMVHRRLIALQPESSSRVSLRVMLYGMFEVWGLRQ